MNHKVKKRDTLLFLQLTLFLVPVGLIEDKVIGYIWYALLSISIGYFLVHFKRSKANRRHSVVFYMLLYLGIQAFSTYLNKGNWIYGIFTALIVSIYCLYVENEIGSNVSRLLKIFDTVMIFELLCECVAYVLGGHFLQQFACIYIYYSAWCCIHMLYLDYHKRNDNKIILVSLALTMLTIVLPNKNEDGSLNFEWTFYVMVIVCCWFYLYRKRSYKLYKLFNIKLFYVFIAAFSFLFVVSQTYMTIPGVKFIIEKVMHKDISLTGRTSIWMMAVNRILQRPIWGYGSGYTSLVQSQDYWTNWLGIHGPHNQFLAIALAGGIITLSAYLIMLYKCTIGLQKRVEVHASVIITFGLIVTYIELSVTYRNILNCMPLFALLCLARNIDIFDGGNIKRVLGNKD